VKRINNSTSPPEQQSNKISFAFSAPLLKQIKDFLSSQWEQGNFTYSSTSHFIRQALTAYQQKKIKLDLDFTRSKLKKEFTIRWPQSDLLLLDFYYSLPVGKRTTILEATTRTYLQMITTQ